MEQDVNRIKRNIAFLQLQRHCLQCINHFCIKEIRTVDFLHILQQGFRVHYSLIWYICAG